MSCMSSRVRLDMDDERGTSKGLSFKQRKGCFIERWMIGLLALLTVCVAVAVGLLVGYLGPCSKKSPQDLTYIDRLEDPKAEKLNNASSLYVMLPRSIVPEHYMIELKPYIFPPNFTFDGRVSINIKCLEDTDNITLHINDMEIRNDTVKLEGESDLPDITNFDRDEKRQFFIIKLDRPLKSGKKYTISMKYLGNLNDQLAGFYRSSYETSTGEKRWLATTQFQATDARRAFPCFDEPAMKATFDVTLVKPQNMTAISNMPESKRETRDDGWEAVTFQRTVPMSTYLLAFIVCDYKSIASSNIKVWTREEALKTAEYALETGSLIIKYFEEFFNVSYPLPKMDMISISDFSAGAMENWGLITFREAALLYDPKISSAGNKQGIASIISHELAHQWFGNLVTPKWWDDLWLNEGFASYVEILGVQKCHPDWEMNQQFVVDDLQEVFELDSLKTSHPISVPVNNPDEITEIFDSISYKKGASVIRMMNYFLGDDTFRRGLTNYLRNKSYDSAVQDDLWKFLTDAQNVPKEEKVEVKSVMDSWTLQTGYPVVTLTRDYNAATATVTQTRFLLNATDSAERYFWEIPVTYTEGSDPNWSTETKLWLHKNNGSISNLPSDQHWVILNIQQVGYYRANYDLHNWKLLIDQLQNDHSVIHVINRAQILDDALDLAKAGILDYGLALNTTLYLSKEQEYVPWEAALNAFSYLDTMLSRTAMLGKWKKYIKRQLEPVYNLLGWEEDINNESVLKQYLRINVIVWMCKYNHPHCVEEAKKRYKMWQNDPNNTDIIPPNFRSIVYCTAIKNGEEEEWEFGWQQYKKAKIASEKDKIMKALACSRTPWLLSRYLDWSLDTKSGIRKQDGSYVFRAVANSEYGRDIAFNYFRDKWNKVFKIYRKTSFAFRSLIITIASSLNTQFELDQLKSFYNVHKGNLGAANRAFKQSLETAEANVIWMSKYYETIKNWLEKVV
ncbi:aminopeptidase N-like [Centruroides vittatus]|uniref:aminopeptidase N-like n=1 Tax=Centruroides vittatus TaxID=120091 RepID=UPI0035107A0D